jgi:metal-responsive CopG/Arc/MetJ family transcriptional regulator
MSKRGRPSVDTEQVTVRLPRGLLDAIDAFRRDQADLPTRPEVIRRVLAERFGKAEA